MTIPEIPHSAAVMPESLTVPAAIFEEMVAHLEAAAPLEGVGLLAVAAQNEADANDSGPADAAGDGGDRDRATRLVTRFYPGTNGAASPTRYTMPPEEVLAAFQNMAANGWRLGAIAHSHPRGPATPSPTDLREAFYPEALMVIVSLVDPRADVRAWWVGDGRPREAPIVVARDAILSQSGGRRDG